MNIKNYQLPIRNLSLHQMRALLIIGFLAASVVGCASLGMRRPVPDESLAEIDRVGVASELTNEFHLIHIGTTIFSNVHQTGTVPSWDVDGFTKTALTTELGKSGSFEVGEIEGTFARKSEDKYKLDYEELARAAEAQGFDTVVLVRPSGYDNAPFHEGGYGFFEKEAFFGSSIRCVYSLFVAQVIDVATQKELAWEWGLPCRDGDEDIIWKERLEDYSDEEMGDIENRLKEGIKASIEDAVIRLRLIKGIPMPRTIWD